MWPKRGPAPRRAGCRAPDTRAAHGPPTRHRPLPASGRTRRRPRPGRTHATSAAGRPQVGERQRILTHRGHPGFWVREEFEGASLRSRRAQHPPVARRPHSPPVATDRIDGLATLVDDAPAVTRSKRSGAAAAGNAQADVITTCPAGRWPSRARRPTAVELGQHVVEHQHRGRPGSLGDEVMRRQSQGQRQCALLALRGMRPRRHPVDGTIARSSRCGPTVETPRRTSASRPRPARLPGPRAATPARTRAPPATAAGEVGVGLGHIGCDPRHERRPGVAEVLADGAILPSHTSSVAPAPRQSPAACFSSMLRWRTMRSSSSRAASYFVAKCNQRVVEEPPPLGRRRP